MLSFCQEIKNEIIAQFEKSRTCCLVSFLYGAMFASSKENEYNRVYSTNVKNVMNLYDTLIRLFSKKKEKIQIFQKHLAVHESEMRYSTIVEIEKETLKCPKCRDSFLKGLFYVYGTVNDPSKSYRLEFVFGNELKGKEAFSYFVSLGLTPKFASRNNKTVIYFTKSEQVEEILARLGTYTAAFSVMNNKINKDMRNSVNRMTNCDSANINKALAATKRYIEVINKLIEADKFDLLPKELKEIALIRIENVDLNFVEIGRLLDPPISKSGVYHRLERILKFYEQNKN